MPRPSRQTDQLLIQAGIELLDQTGFSGLNIRQVALRAGVNLGMFHYHFKTKDEFTRKVLSQTYEKFFSEFSLESAAKVPSLERLRRALNILGRFVRDNRRLILGLTHDVMSGNREVQSFMTQNAPRHIRVMVALVRLCQREKVIIKAPLVSTLAFLAGSIAAPNLISGFLEQAEIPSVAKGIVKLFRGQVISDKAISRRVELALRGITLSTRRS